MTVRAADDDAPFSESMLEWLEEGDRMGEAPPGGMPRPSSAHHTLESPKRRERVVIGVGAGVAVALVLVLHFMGGGKPAGEEATEARPAPAPTALPAAVAPVAPAAPAALVAAAPVAAAAVAPAGVPAQEPAAVAPVAAAPAQEPTAVAPAAPPAVVVVPAPVAAAAAAPAAAVDTYAASIAECRASMNAGRVARAVAACRAAADAHPQSAEALTLLAEAEFTRGHTGVALHLATSATEANQNYPDAYVILGGVYQEKGKNAEARAAYEQYLALAPKGKHASDLRAILASLP